jgi:hypothetical protein
MGLGPSARALKLNQRLVTIRRSSCCRSGESGPPPDFLPRGSVDDRRVVHARAVGVHRNPAHSVATYRRRALPPAALLAATWLVLKMTGCLERRARRSARVFLVGMLAFIVIVSVWTVLEFERIGQR